MTRPKMIRPTLFALALAAAFAARAAADGPATAPADSPATRPAVVITFDTAKAPDMADFAARAHKVADDWYPKIAALLPSDGFTPPTQVTVTFDPAYKGVAACSGTKIVCNPAFYRDHPDDVGSIVHELVHVVQGYGYGDRPTWLVEGIADQIRWFVYEPAEKRSKLDPDKARYDASYQTSGAFLDWAQRTYDPRLVADLNAACRAGEYDRAIWKTLTGKSLEELGTEWKASLRPPATLPA